MQINKSKTNNDRFKKKNMKTMMKSEVLITIIYILNIFIDFYSLNINYTIVKSIYIVYTDINGFYFRLFWYNFSLLFLFCF